MRLLLVVYCFLIFPSLLKAQTNSVQETFSSPLKIPFSFSGNFGELRPSHFHSGLDFRTQGRTGIPVYAVKEGYISRVSVSATGYGNALYLTHPDGKTTVYGHLSRFSSRLAAFVKDRQYYTENFQINVSLAAGEFEITRGELIAWSGDTGNSGGPHLHFEVRDTKSENVENPLFFIRGIKDNSPPAITSVYVYPLTAYSHVNRSGSKKRFSTVKTKNEYLVTNNPLIEVYGKIGIGIQTTDDYGRAGIKCGIYSATLSCDGKAVFGFKMDTYSFDQTRYANSQMDYEEEELYSRKIQRLYKQPGNELSIYDPQINKGVLDLEDGKIHIIQVIVRDAFHNQSSLKFKLASRKYPLAEKQIPCDRTFTYNKENIFRNEEVKLVVPNGALYDNLNFIYGFSPKTKGFYSKIHKIHYPEIPLHKPVSISVKAKDLPEHLKEKCLLVKLDKKGQLSSAGGEFSDGWVTTLCYEFGNYGIAVDTISPVIIPLSIRDKKNLIENDQIRFKIGDNLSGIKIFRGTIDDRWVLFEYNSKTRIITHLFDKDKMKFNQLHHLSLVLFDNMKNKSEYTATFFK